MRVWIAGQCKECRGAVIIRNAEGEAISADNWRPHGRLLSANVQALKLCECKVPTQPEVSPKL